MLNDEPLVRIAVKSNVVSRALRSVAAEIGLKWTTDDAASATVLLSDELDDATASKMNTVLIVDPTPVSCRQALEAIMSRAVNAVLTSDAPELLPDILQATRAGLAAIPTSVLQRASDMPPLSSRRASILAALMAGQSNRAISRALHVSEATVKREITALLDSFDASNRVGLVAEAHAMGVSPTRLR